MKDLPWVVDRVCITSFFSFLGNVRDILSPLIFIGVSEGAIISSDCDEIPTEAETRGQCRRRRAVVTRRLVPLAGGASVPFTGSSHNRSRELLEEAFDIGMYHIIRCASSLFSNIAPQFLCFMILDHFTNDPVATPIRATGHQLVTLCRSVCAEERSQILEPIMSSK